MTPQRFQAILDELGWTYSEAGRILHMHRSTASRLANGRYQIHDEFGAGMERILQEVRAIREKTPALPVGAERVTG